MSHSAKAILQVTNLSGIQHNIWIYGTGTNYGVSANVGTTTFAVTGALGMWIKTESGIGTLSGAPMETLYVGTPTFPSMVTTSEIYPPMTTTYTVQVIATMTDIYVTFFPF